MKRSLMKRDISQYRFALPNDIWRMKLKPPAFAVLAYLQYRCCRSIGGDVTARELAQRTGMSERAARQNLESLLACGLVTDALVPVLYDTGAKKFFTLPDEIFSLEFSHGAITVYAYLLYCEDRRTHQCHPSYNTISSAVGLAVNTVMKHINELAERQLIAVERTSYIDANGMKWNGNNLYTILPIQQAVDAFYQRQLNRLDLAAEQRRITELLRERESPA